MAKPICAIYIARDALMSINESVWDACHEMCKSYESHMPDYYIFVLPDYRTEGHVPVVDFKVFHEKDFTEVEYSELKDIIETKLKSTHPA